MEVSLDNSVPFMVKITLLPCWKLYNQFTEKLVQGICCGIHFLLNNPALTMILASISLILFLPLLLYSFLTTIAVCCFLWAIIIFEGFIMMSLLILLTTIGIIIMGLINICWVTFRNDRVNCEVNRL